MNAIFVSKLLVLLCHFLTVQSYRLHKVYDQTYRGSASRGLQSPFLPVPLTGAHRFLSIIAQDFSPGSTCGPAESRQSSQSLYRGAAVEVEDLAGDEVGLGA